MNEHMKTLTTAIQKWRSSNIADYWVHVGYIGPELNRFGDHTLTFVDGTLWHLWKGEARKIEAGSDFWLFSVNGTFAWARDLVRSASDDAEASALTIRANEQYGYLEYLQSEAGHRDSGNFTLEVKRFGEGAHPDFSAEQAAIL